MNSDDAKYAVEWVSGFNRNLLLKQIREQRTVRNNSSSFKMPAYEYWLTILQSAIRVDRSVSHFKSRAVEKTLADPTLSLTDPSEFVRRCSRAIRSIATLPVQKYVVLTSTTYVGPKPIGTLKDDLAQFDWPPTKRFYSMATKARRAVADLLRAHGVNEQSEGLTAVAIKIEAIDPRHAYHLAIERMDILRGLLNLLVNKGWGFDPFARLSRQPPHATNKFRPGPFSTVHHPDGSLATNVTWYETRWAHDQPSAVFKGDQVNNRRQISRWWSRIQTNSLKRELCDGLVRYCRALDQHDSDVQLVGLWGALEVLAGLPNERHEALVLRVAKLFNDVEVAQQIAQHLKHRRNLTVHAALSPEFDEVEYIVRQAESFVSTLLFFYLWHGSFFASHRELVDFLDLSLDETALKRRKQIIDRFITFRSRP